MEYKPTYTKEEIEEVIAWFQTHQCEQDIDMGGGIHIRELSKTLEQLFHIARTQHENRVFSGQIYFLFRIRDELLKQNNVIGEK